MLLYITKVTRNKLDILYFCKSFSVLSLFFWNRKKKLAKFNLTNLDNRDDSTDGEYWLKYENLIDEKKDKLWDAILFALQKYQ